MERHIKEQENASGDNYAEIRIKRVQVDRNYIYDFLIY